MTTTKFDERKVPAFDASMGLPMNPGEPDKVQQSALTTVNDTMKQENAAVIRHHNEVVTVASLFAARAIRPDEVAALRRRMLEAVNGSMDDVVEVMAGRKTWSPVQARLFSVLTERVLPRMSAEKAKDHGPKAVEEMTIEELEAVVRGKQKEDATDAIMTHGKALDREAEKQERKAATQELVRELALVDAIDEAEKKYIARRFNVPLEQIAEEEERRAIKPQPQPSPEALANLRQAREMKIEDWWREKGMTEEEIVKRKQLMIERRRETARAKRVAKEAAKEALGLSKETKRPKAVDKAMERSEAAMSEAMKMGLGQDEHEMANDIEKRKRETLRDFRVHNRKGVRTQASVQKDIAKRERVERKLALERDPFVSKPFAQQVPGVPDDEREGLRLSTLRKYRPDLFEVAVEAPSDD